MIARPQSSRARLVVANLALAAVSLLVAALLAEALVRAFFPQPLIIRRPDVWFPVAGPGWDRTPNLDTTVNFAGAGPVRLLTDAEGNRVGASGPVRDPELRILAIGDSYVEALQVPYEQTMTWRLQEALTRATGKRVEVACAGVSGWGPSQYLFQSRRKMASGRYDLQLVFVYIENDLEVRRAQDYPPLHPSTWHSFRVPRNSSRAELVDALLRPVNDWMELRSEAFILARNRLRNLLARFGLASYRVPFSIERAAAAQPWWDITADILQDIERTGAEQGAPTLFVLIPPNYYFVDLPLKEAGFDPETMDLTQAHRILSRKFAERGLRTADLLPAFGRAYAEGIQPFGAVDVHLSAAGHRVAAGAIMEPVRELLEAGGAGRRERNPGPSPGVEAPEPMREGRAP